MAGEYYRYLARDVKPEEKRELTPREKRQNWWHYHKWQLLIGLLCLVMLGSVVSGAVRNSRNVPDYTIAFVGKAALPDETCRALEQAFASVGEDLNGNGKVQVELLQFRLQDQDAELDPLDMERAAEQAYNAAMLLMVNVETVQSVIYLLEEPELFQAQYQVLARADGSRPEADSDAPMWYSWSDCPVLTGLELGEFEIPVVGGMAVGDSQKAMESVYIARRGLWENGTNETIEGALRLFDKLTEGAE